MTPLCWRLREQLPDLGGGFRYVCFQLSPLLGTIEPTDNYFLSELKTLTKDFGSGLVPPSVKMNPCQS